LDKSKDPEIIESCPDIEWHLIGHLQSNKINQVLSVPGLSVIETVDSEKLASSLDKGWSKQDKGRPLNIMIQINTSGEESTS
jgi:PLP dependent protein